MDEEKKRNLLLEILTTLLVIALYWISTQPDWKLEMYLRWLTERLPRPVRESRDKLNLAQKEILRKFRQEISDWEHEQQ